MRPHLCNGCDFCENAAESRAADLEPDYDESGAADQYERYFDGPVGI